MKINFYNMKKLLLFVLCMCVTVAAFAQDEAAFAQAEHMTFKGIPMDCDISTFVSRMEAKGYTLEYPCDEYALMSGRFATKDECKIYIYCTEDSKLVYQVIVSFPEYSRWDTLRDEYYLFKEAYTEKYGEPESQEYFLSPYYEGDGHEMSAVESDYCRYSSFYETPSGKIVLWIGSGENVLVAYRDHINNSIKDDETHRSIAADI